MKDLFYYPELLPLDVQDLLLDWEDRLIDGADYPDLEDMLDDFESYGYTFDYGLDAEPYDLKPL